MTLANPIFIVESHEGPEPVDDTVISQEEFDKQSLHNVVTWVSAHIVPVSLIGVNTSRLLSLF